MVVDLARTWTLILVAFAFFVAHSSIASFIVAFLVVATQQYALLILMHDGQHWMLHPQRRVNNFIAKWLIAAPCMTPFQSSQEQHLAHHRNLGSIKDPAFIFYCFGEPSPKDTPVHIALHFLRIVLVDRLRYSVLPRKAAQEASETTTQIGSRLSAYAPIVIVQGLMSSGFFVAGHAWTYFILWVLPLISLVSFFDAFRQFSEHAHPGPDGTAETLLVSIRSNVVERIFFAPFGMNFHAEHHMFPYVPYYRLAELSTLIRGAAEGAGIVCKDSYLRCLREYVRNIEARRGAQAQSSPND